MITIVICSWLTGLGIGAQTIAAVSGQNIASLGPYQFDCYGNATIANGLHLTYYVTGDTRTREVRQRLKRMS